MEIKRLTYKSKTRNDYARKTSPHYEAYYEMQKLGQLEDIEEELGIDLITLFKALKNGIWVKAQNIEVKGFGTFKTKTHLLGNEIHLVELVGGWALQVINPINSEELIQEWFLKEYKTEWFLTKEELEK